MADPSQQRAMRPRQPVPGTDPALARLSDMLLAVLSQMTMLRERLDTVERLIERHGVFPRSEIEGFVPDAAAEISRTALRRRQIDKVLRPLLDDARRAAEASSGEEPA